ncbi:alpha/beta fold hydrolase [Rhodobacter sp. HX-7-19]|uniref:Alpha/beta fold hydrolase n=1 Tax=Paragemmobacter kunshanensis TaxID=2583234 RepID=A0A6M1TMB0_9RHOB|nr:alpha/beta fold hydrolase [Rhodobacter kunshanensis]NGQ91139.1 alpha/beta fold hydrolase [Rhodobacter kunshanensis]
MRPIALLILSIALAACTPRGAMVVVPPETAEGPISTVFVGTTRGLQGTGVFGTERSEEMRFARYDVAIPPQREVGEIRYAKPRRPNVSTDFVTTDQRIYAADADFRGDLGKALAANGREAVIFVHGFNNTFTEGLYRIAQLHHDLEIPGVALHYSWPSAAEPLGYVYDRDSIMFAREGLEELIREARAAGATRITLVAHSMGSFLSMEALRDIALRDGRIMPELRGVILISPDIDVEVFRMQARDIGTLPQPFVIFGSDRDRVLRLSALITGQRGRLGSLDSVDRLSDLEVTYLDVGAFSSGSGHFVPGTSPALIRLLGRISDVDQAFGNDAAGRAGLLPGVILTARSATRVILTPVAEITGDSLN